VPPVYFICLAHSKKYSKRCVAGVRLDTGKWIRPVSREKHGELSPAQVKLSDGGDPRHFDIVCAWLGEHVPVKNQPENWKIQNYPWKLVTRPAGAEHAGLIEAAWCRDPVLFGNTSDRVDYRTLEKTPATESLILVKPEHPRWIVKRTLTWKKQLRVQFHLGTVSYDLAVTDIPYDDKLKDLELGERSSEQMGIAKDREIYFTVSLAEPLDNGFCFKLVAAVLLLPSGWPALE
jgi:hypothetical protein